VIRLRTQTKLLRFGALALVTAGLFGCQQRMAHQPGNRTMSETSFFPDKRSARPLEEGVVHRFQMLDDDPQITGLSAAGKKPQTVKLAGGKDGELVTGPGIPNSVENFKSTFPFTLSKDDLKRGQERYGVFCTPCHGAAGDGWGKIRERGYLSPPSYHTDNSRGFAFYAIQLPLRDVPVGYIFEVITKGYGGMPDHSSQIPVADRWRIVAYVKALQLSHNPDKLTPEQKAEIEKALGDKK
jgi:mono/diheme cytochrome c family protein